MGWNHQLETVPRKHILIFSWLVSSQKKKKPVTSTNPFDFKLGNCHDLRWLSNLAMQHKKRLEECVFEVDFFRGHLGGGFYNVLFYFHLELWGRYPIWLIFLQMGWFNHQPVSESPVCEGSNTAKCKVILKDFCYSSALFWVGNIMTPLDQTASWSKMWVWCFFLYWGSSFGEKRKQSMYITKRHHR